MKRCHVGAGILAAWLFGCGFAPAQEFPNRLVRIVVPYPPGGGIDAVARPLAQKLSERWGQPVIVENRPGAGTSIGAEQVARAAPDGYTLLLSDITTFAINPHVYRKLPYDPLVDFAPVTTICRLTPVVAVNAEVPAKTLPEFLELARKTPGKLSYGSFGNGTYAHIAMEELKRAAQVDILHVPYRGGAPALNDLIAGQIAASMATITNFSGHEPTGKLRILAAATAQRPPLRPSLPTVAETVPGYAIDVWVGVAAPAATPPALLDRVRADIAAVIAEPAYREKYLTSQFLDPVGNSREDFAASLKRDFAHWKAMVERTGARIE